MNTFWTFQLTELSLQTQDRILNVCHSKNPHILIAVGDENLSVAIGNYFLLP